MSPSDFKDEENFIRTQLSSAASLAAATVSQRDSDGELGQKQLDEIVELVTTTKRKGSNDTWGNKVLWVDDRPENNIYGLFATLNG